MFVLFGLISMERKLDRFNAREALLRELIGVLPRSADVRLGVDRMKARLGLRTLKDLQGLMDHILGDQPSVAAFMVAEARVHAWTENFEN